MSFSLEEIFKGRIIWDDNTIHLYFFIIISCYVLGWISQKKIKGFKLYSYSKSLVFISFLIFSVFLFFRDIGTDLPMYKTIYNNINLGSGFFNSQEPGFMLLNKILSIFYLKDYVAIGILGILTIFLYYKTISENSNKICVGIAILAYGCLFYFQSYSLVRMYLASGILIYASKYLLLRRFKVYIIIVILTILIHYSAILAFIPLVFYLLYLNNKRDFIISYIIFFVISYFGANYLSSINIFARYDEYLSGGAMKGGIGLFQIAINIPMIFLYLYSKPIIGETTILKIFFVYTLSAILIGILSYKILMLGRSLVYYNIIYILCIPYVLKQLKNIKSINYKLWYILFFIYLIWRFYQYLSEYLLLDGLMPFKFVEIS